MLVGVLAAAVVLGAVILVIHFGTHIDVELLISDPAEKGHLPGYTGIYTYAGAFALLVGGAVSFFAAALVRERACMRLLSVFLVQLGVLVVWLGMDDLFMIHEWAGLAIAELVGRGDEPGARSRLESVVFVVYGLAWLAWISRHWPSIRETAYLLLLLAFLFFGLSLSIDVGTFLFPGLVPDTAWAPTTIAVAEEMLKLAGIFFAFTYCWDTAMSAVRRMMDRADVA